MQFACTFNPLELRLDARDALFDHAAVGLDLGFARTAKKSKPAALALEVRPRTDQPAFLIGEMRQLDLQRPFPRTRASAENFKDQTGAVDNFGVPGLFKIALLNWRDGTIHHDDGSRQTFRHAGDFINLAFADVGCRPNLAKRDKPRLHDGQVDRACKPDSLLEARLRRT